MDAAWFPMPMAISFAVCPASRKSCVLPTLDMPQPLESSFEQSGTGYRRRFGAGIARLCLQMRISQSDCGTKWRHRFCSDRRLGSKSPRKRKRPWRRPAICHLVRPQQGRCSRSGSESGNRFSHGPHFRHSQRFRNGPGSSIGRYGKDVTEENIQARARGLLLMALSNKYGALLLTTGNKRAIRRLLHPLRRHVRRARGNFRPAKGQSVRAGSTYESRRRDHTRQYDREAAFRELRPDQKDEDSLPPYDVLDGILKAMSKKESPLMTSSLSAMSPTSSRISSPRSTSMSTNASKQHRA